MRAIRSREESRVSEDDITIRRVPGGEAAGLVPALADVLIDCVEGGASVGFMLPLARDRALAFWGGVATGAERGERVLVVAEDRSGAIAGTVQLVLSLPDNQPHRGDVAKMLVRSGHRRRGIAARLLAAVEAVARDEGRSVLVLDAVTGGDAARLYARSGWQRVGDIPDYALMPNGGFCSTTYFHKRV
jgi:GNAT superfamily N-acetyltransferase